MKDNWKEKKGKIGKEFGFNNFKEAISFVNKVGDLAEEAGHHPDILIFDYKNVIITLTSHDVRKVTDRDIDLAKKIDATN
ncbi:MAG: 4a-hydroxytetrahydrobiopterin dehydratase [Candidatus Kerfeldbacteria bacterium]|jgi:4a-hydroxytetrahydrobiopterin dehydratase